MSDLVPVPKGNIVALRDSKVLSYPGGQLRITPDAGREFTRFFLASEVLVSRYNVVSFLVADKEAQGTPEWLGPEGASYIGSTKKNQMAILRHVLMPQKVKELFESDPYLGWPMIKKLCSADLPVLKEMGELDLAPLDGETTWAFTSNEELLMLSDVIISTLGMDRKGYFRSMYWIGNSVQDFISVVENVKPVLGEMAARFDKFISRFDIRPAENPVLAERKEII